MLDGHQFHKMAKILIPPEIEPAPIPRVWVTSSLRQVVKSRKKVNKFR